MVELNGSKRSKFGPLRLFYYRIRLRISNVYDSVKARLGLSSSRGYETDTEGSTSFLDSDYRSLSEEEEEQLDESELPISSKKSRHNLICTSEDEASKCTENDSRGTRKIILRKRRSSRTRNISDCDMETVEDLKMAFRSGIGDQPDNYDSADEDTENSEKHKSIAEGHESKSSYQKSVSKTKNSDENSNSYETCVERPQPVRKDPPRFKTLKLKRKPSISHGDEIIISSQPNTTKNKGKQIAIIAEKVKEPKKKENVNEGKGTVSRKKTVAEVKEKTSSLISSFISSVGQPRAESSYPKTAHVALGLKFVRTGSVRKHTCGQEFRKIFHIPENSKRIEPKPAVISQKKNNDEDASPSPKNKAETYESKKNNFAETADHRMTDHRLISSLETRIRDRQYPPFVSYSPYTPKTYPDGQTFNEYKRVSPMENNCPPVTSVTTYSRQFGSHIPNY